MANDQIPRPDARFNAWRNNFVTYINGHVADLAPAIGQVMDLNNCAATWTAGHPYRTAA